MIYKLRIKKLLYFIFLTIISIIFCIYIAKAVYNTPNHKIEWAFIPFVVLFLAVYSAPIFLCLTYLIEDFRKTIILDNEFHSIIFQKGKNKITLSPNEIASIYHVLVDKESRFLYRQSSFEYIVIIIKERKRFYITNLICDPSVIINFLKIKDKTIYSNIPFIDRKLGFEVLTTEEFNKNVKEFECNFENYSKDQLIKIINDKGSYMDYARQAAINLLNRKKSDGNNSPSN
jgi:hypothetical protein